MSLDWKPLFKNWKEVIGPRSEVTPFVFKSRLYLLENFKRAEEFPGQALSSLFHEDGFRIRDSETGRIVSSPLVNHYFSIAFVWEGRVHVFSGDYEYDLPRWHIRKLITISSEDMITWTKPTPVLFADEGEHLFNTGVCHDGRRFILLYETDDPQWPKFTFKFAESNDLIHWRKLPNSIYGVDKYVGGPALYYEGGNYYVTYLKSLGGNHWETHVTRSADLVRWEDAPADRPILKFNPERRPDPLHYPNVYETNASDLEMCEWQGKTVLYWNGGDQRTIGDVQSAEFNGSRRDLLELVFYRSSGEVYK